MDDFGQIHLVSPPSSLPDGLLAPRVSTPPVPRPRKATSLSLSSTPKQPSNARHLPHINGHDYYLSRNKTPQQGIRRAPSLDSATHRDLPLSPISRIQDVHSDSETEDDCSPPSHRRSISRLSNGSHHGKHFKKPQQHSHSLPATPRVNTGSQASFLNGNFPLATSPSYHGIPCLLAPHTLNQSNQDNISQTSHYITCESGVSHLGSSGYLNQGESKLPGAIDYSSLPLPHDEVEPVRRPSDIIRHLSEPCIIESQAESRSLPYSTKKKGTRNRYRPAIHGKDNGMDNIKESGQSECETEEIHTLEVQWRFIQTLVAELNTTKCNNRKLMAELHQAKMEIQVLKASLDSYTESGLQPGAITEMVSQIHAAQKVRDEAMMARIKLANEERDAALTHSRTLLDKISLSPRSNTDQGGEPNEQEMPSGGNSSCTSSPRRSDRRYRRSSVSSLSSSTPYTSAPPAFPQGSETRSTGDRETSTLSQLATLEEELRTLRLATTIHHTMHEGGEANAQSSAQGQGISRSSAEYMEGLCSQLRESEASRWQLHDQCTRLERLVNVLRKKVNGLSTVESIGQDGTKLTLVDLTLRGPNSEGPPSSGPHPLPTSTSSEGEPKDSLSSLESVETASASSWRRGDVPSSIHSTTNLHSNSLNHGTSPNTSLSSHHIHHASFVHSTLSQSNSEKSVPITSNHSTSYSSSSGITPHLSPHHRQHSSSGTTERDSRNIPGVTIVGPITEL